MRNRNMADKMSKNRTLIYNSMDGKVKVLLEERGVDEAYLQRGVTLYGETETYLRQVDVERQDQKRAYDEYHVQKDSVQEQMDDDLKLVRTLSRKDKDLQNRLELTTGRATAVEQWIEKGLRFYSLLLQEPEFVTKLAKFKLDAHTIAANQQTLSNLKVLRDTAQKEKGEAQEATRLRNEKMEELEDYCYELKALAQLALKGKPQLLEKLGITVR